MLNLDRRSQVHRGWVQLGIVFQVTTGKQSTVRGSGCTLCQVRVYTGKQSTVLQGTVYNKYEVYITGVESGNRGWVQRG